MKIYLDNLDPRTISKKFKNLHLYFRKFKMIMELVSGSGIYHIENNRFFRLKPVDCPIKKIQENVIIDESYFIKTEVYSQIPTDYLSSLVTTFIYSFNEKSKLELHVEGYYKNIKVNSKNNPIHPLMKEPEPPSDLDKKYHYFVPTDFYFCIGNKEDKIEKMLESAFFQEELKEWIEFLGS
jgi:hypothetical protein